MKKLQWSRMVLFIGCCLIAEGLGGCKHAVAPSRDSGSARRLPGVVCQKTYLYDKNGESLGAAWYDEWIAPDGRVVRKTQPSRKALGEDGN